MERWFISIVGSEKYLYWVTELGFHLMRMEIETWKVEYLRPNMNFHIDEMNRSAVLCYKDKKVYCVSNRGEKILIYDEISNNMKCINIYCSDMNLNMYNFSCVLEDKLVIIPIFGKEILYIDINIGDIKKVNILEDMYLSNEFKQIFTVNSFVKENTIEFISTVSNELITYSLLESRIIKKVQLPVEMYNAVDFVYYNNELIILNTRNEIVSWNGDDCKIKLQIDSREGGYSLIHKSQDTLWVLPLFAEDIYSVSLVDEKIEKYSEYPIDYKYSAPSTMGKFFKKYTFEDKTYFAMHSGNALVFSDDQSGELKIIQLQWPDIGEDIKELKYQNRTMLNEEGIPLSTFLKYLKK